MRTVCLAVIITFLVSLSTLSTAEEQDFQFKTADLLAPPWNRIGYDVFFKKVDDRLYSMRLVFPGQLGVTTGYSVEDASFVSYCLSGIVAARQSYDGSSQGFDKSLMTSKTLGASELVFFLLLLRKGESAQSAGPAHLFWSPDFFNDNPAFRDVCRKMLRPESLWWRE